MDKHINSTAEIIARALGGHKSGNGWMARCPLPRRLQGLAISP
jgi:hypothetical protein